MVTKNLKIKDGFFYCYSINLLRFLRKHGLDDIGKEIHPITKRSYWIFPQDIRLSYLLQQWNFTK